MALKPAENATCATRVLPAVYRIKRFDAAVLDAPIWVHWPKLGPWLVFEGVLLGLTGYLDHMNVASKAYRPPGTEDDCTEWQYNCSLGGERACWSRWSCLPAPV